MNKPKKKRRKHTLLRQSAKEKGGGGGTLFQLHDSIQYGSTIRRILGSIEKQEGLFKKLKKRNPKRRSFFN
jgi:hypothetical protein